MMALEALIGMDVSDKAPIVKNDLFSTISPLSDVFGQRGLDRYGHVDNEGIQSLMGKKVELRKKEDDSIIVVIEGIAFEGKSFTSKESALEFALQEINERYGEPVQQ